MPFLDHRRPATARRSAWKALAFTVLAVAAARPARAAGPVAPSGFTASPSTYSVSWFWIDNSTTEAGFRVVVATTGFNISGDLPSNTTTWLQSSLTPNWRVGPLAVVAFNGAGVSTSAPVTVHTLALVPGAPSIIAVSTGSIAAAWPSGGNPAGTSFTSQLSTDPAFSIIVQSTQSVALGTSFPGLSPATTYYLRVNAQNGDLVSSAYAATTSTMTNSGPSPAAPSGLTASPTLNSITWRWIDNSSDETGFRVVTGTGGIVSGDLAVNTTYWDQVSLAPNTPYGSYFAEAFNAGGTGRSSGLTNYTLADNPSSLNIAGTTATAVSINWAGGANPAGTLFKAEISADPTFTVITATAQTTALATTFSGLSAATSYYVRVQAINGDGVGTGYINAGPAFTQLFSHTQNALATGGVNNAVTLLIAPSTLNSDFAVSINADPIAAPISSPNLPDKIAQANTKAVSDASLSGIVDNKLVEINIFDGLNQSIGGVLNKSAEITFRFSHNGGIVDAAGMPIRAKTLAIYMLNERDNLWVKLPGSRVNMIDNSVSAPTPHFSVFTLMGQVDLDLSTAYAYPVPFRPSRGDSRITFTNLAQAATIRIFTVSGKLVRKLDVNDGTGALDWDVRNSDGADIASGVYFYLIESQTDRKKGKLIIIR